MVKNRKRKYDFKTKDLIHNTISLYESYIPYMVKKNRDKT